MRFRHISIVTHGRSGSTLLSGILNSIPGVCIRGENGAALFRLFAAVRALVTARSMISESEDATDPWFGSSMVDIERLKRRLVEVFVEEVLRPPPDAVAVGFKEIRYGVPEMPDGDYDAYLEFLLASFERACLIFNVRNAADAANSAWLAANPLSERYLRRTQIRFRNSHAKHPSESYWVDYDRYVRDPEQLRGLFDFLGADFDRASIDATMAVRHSFGVSEKQGAEFQASRNMAAALADDFALRLQRWAGRR